MNSEKMENIKKVLSSCDDMIELSIKKVELMKEYKKALHQSFFDYVIIKHSDKSFSKKRQIHHLYNWETKTSIKCDTLEKLEKYCKENELDYYIREE